MAPNIFVVYDNPSRVYFPGQSITGRVEVNADKPISSKGITLKLTGYCRVSFTKQEKDSHRNRSDTVHYIGKESYYDAQFNLWGSTAKTLAVGNHRFPFTFVLPPQVPSSFESKAGHIRHLCEAVLKISAGFNKKCIAPYSVISLLDLNYDAFSKSSIILSEDKTVCCLCCQSGPISLSINVDHSGYVPGESMRINAECCNKSNRTMKGTRAEIIQKVCYKARGRHINVNRVVCFKERPAIPPNGNDIWSGESLVIPPLPPSHLPGCSLIEIDYLFVFKGIPSGPATNLKIESNLIIGTIPLRQVFNQFAYTLVPRAPFPTNVQGEFSSSVVSMPPIYDQNQRDPLPEPSAPPFVFPGVQQYPDLPPPAYEDCVFGSTSVGNDGEDGKNAGTDNDVQFAPQYISYHFLNTPPEPNTTDPGFT